MKKIIYLIFLLINFTNVLRAQELPVKHIGTKEIFIQTNQSSNVSIVPSGKNIFIEEIDLTPQAKEILKERIKQITTHPFNASKSLRLSLGKISIGMNNVPVLDQGRHATCATFATTAALDAFFGSDLISQLCYLEMTEYLSTVEYHLNGWEGNSPNTIFDDFKKYGIVSKNYQQKKGCAQVFEYPLMNKNDHGRPMSTQEYLNASQDIMSKINPINILYGTNTATQARAALKRGNRVLFCTLLDINYGNGSFGTYRKPKDSWILTPEILQDSQRGDMRGKHCMVIFGYDDEAIIRGAENGLQQGVFTLRNSWGTEPGDGGNYYMTYDYFNTFIINAYEIAAR